MKRWDERRDERLAQCSISYWKAPGPAHRLFAFIEANKDKIQL